MAAIKKTTAKAAKKADEVKTEAQLQDELLALRAAHLESRKSHRAGELVNPHVLTVQRKNIARTLTALNATKNTALKEEN
jgi:ribosomal protein L29